MAKKPTASDREALLEDFAERHPLPSVEDIVAFQQEHPALAAAVMDLAMALLGASLERGKPEDHLATEEDVDLVLAAMGDPYTHRHDVDLVELIALAKTTPGDLADEMKLTRKTIAAIVEGGVIPPISGQLRRALSAKLGVGPEAVNAALSASYASPRVGLHKASSAPKIVQRTFADLIATSGMDEERKAFWMKD